MDLAPAMAPMGPLTAPPNVPGRNAAVALTLAVHVLLAVLLVYGIHWQTQLPESVAVELVVAVPPAPTLEPQPAAPPEPVQKVEPKPEPKPAPPPPKPDIAVKEKKKPKPPSPRETPPPKADPFAEQLKRETEQLARKRETDVAAAELDKLKADQAQAARSKAVRGYMDKIVNKIRPLIVLPPDVKGNPEAVFDVTQLPSGEILGVKLRKSSGHAAWDAATERAILKASPLPKPERGDMFQRDLRLTFRPLDD
ncbi:MAG: energy transducer TonB [Sulfurisoma sp.]|nr:energy transducer TonB [Sulfurisoma sp.]